MEANFQAVAVRDSGVSMVDTLMIEHRLLREQMRKLDDWLDQGMAAEVLRERASLLAVALEGHAQTEEEKLFASLRRRSETARRLIEPMEIDHEHIRALFEEIREGSEIPRKLKLVLDLAESHFAQEEEELFPLAAEYA